MDFDKINAQWNRVSFALDNDSPQDLRIDMFVRTAAGAPAGKVLYDVGWAEEFNMDNTCSFKTLERVQQETGIDFSLVGLQGDLGDMFALCNITKRDVVWLHAISRFWAIKNGLMDKVAQKQGDVDASAETAALIEKKMKRLEKMTFKVLEQNKTIFKTIKKTQT